MNEIFLKTKAYKTRCVFSFAVCALFLFFRAVPVNAATLTPDANGYVTFSWSAQNFRGDGSHVTDCFNLSEVESITATVGACSGPKTYGAQRVPGYSRVYVVSDVTGDEVQIAAYSSYTWPGGTTTVTKNASQLSFTGLAHLKVELSSPGTNGTDDPGYANATVKILCKQGPSFDSNLTYLDPPQNALFLPKPHHNILIYPIGNYSVFKVRFYQ